MMDHSFDRVRKKTGWTRLGGVLCVAGALFFSTAAQAGSCTSAQRDALTTRLVQTELMVSALSCGARAPYNVFIQKNRTVLSDQGKRLKALFRQVYGTGAEKKLNAFVTRLANQASARHAANYTEFCHRTTRALNALNTGTTLRTVAARHPLSDTVGGAVCGTDGAMQQATVETSGQTGTVR